MEIILKEDYIIPKGTVFENIDWQTTEYRNWNYWAMLSPSDNTVLKLIVDEEVLKDRPDIFKVTDN